ncbi:MAG: hypothetical protein LQ341_003799, partial [Variospora aurantia]
LMGDVYANSHCNIAATWNSSSDDGCFTKRNPSEVEGLIVHPKWTGLKSTTFRVVEFGLWEDLVTSAGLNKRAWVVQERLLAPRVLHFGRTQLAWECHEVDACETYPAGLPVTQQSEQTMQKALDPGTEGKKLQSMGDSRSSPNLHARHIWNKIVAAYTAGELTVASDKLVAIMGLAVRMQSLIQSDYLAGLWRDTLSSDLLWKVIGHEAVTDPVVPKNPSGQLNSGWIRLRGVLLQGTVKPLDSSTSQPDKLHVYFAAGGNDTADHWIFPDIQNELSDQSVFCLVISTKNQYDGTLVQGLVLHCADTVKATYRRVGLFESEYKSSKQHSLIQYSKSNRRVELSSDAESQTIVLI